MQWSEYPHDFSQNVVFKALSLPVIGDGAGYIHTVCIGYTSCAISHTMSSFLAYSLKADYYRLTLAQYGAKEPHVVHLRGCNLEHRNQVIKQLYGRV